MNPERCWPRRRARQVVCRRLQTIKIRDIETDIDVPDMRRLAGLMREHALLDRDIDLEPMVFKTP